MTTHVEMILTSESRENQPAIPLHVNITLHGTAVYTSDKFEKKLTNPCCSASFWQTNYHSRQSINQSTFV